MNKPSWKRDVESWPEEVRIDWEERAAIREYDGGMKRSEAEFEAYKDMLRMQARRTNP